MKDYKLIKRNVDGEIETDVHRELKAIFNEWHAPRILHTDNGSEFRNSIVEVHSSANTQNIDNVILHVVVVASFYRACAISGSYVWFTVARIIRRRKVLWSKIIKQFKR